VDSRIRNSRIASVAVDLASSGLSSLIIVKEIQHGDNITDMIRMKGHKCSFVQGNTSGEIRDAVKEQLEQKGIKIVVCTAVWKEGVNIPSLNCVINAAGGKSEISTLQAIGRGLRSVPGKKEIVIYDFLDPYKYLAQHAIQRIAIYVEAGWL
jgi:superfamily II DNA or RNA helicase